MKKIVCIALTLFLFFGLPIASFAENGINNGAEYNLGINENITISAKSAILMDGTTGEILYEKNSDEALPPASVTKVMTLLLVCEAMYGGNFTLDDTVTVSDYAASMGGSQVFLREGEQITVRDLLKSTVIASGNDAAVALAELTAGSESLFVAKMNEKAREMELTGCSFENVTGLDDTVTNHTMSAKDIAKISRELIKYPEITEYASIWQDSIRGGEFTLTNTNRLVRYYSGCNGLKTGSTDKAGYCVSATAKRDNMQLISVIMGAESKDIRNTEAKTLLDYGFSSFYLYESDECVLETAPVHFGKTTSTPLIKESFCKIIKRSDVKNVEAIYGIPEFISAPAKRDEPIGEVVYKIGEYTLGKCNIYVESDIEKLDFLTLFATFVKSIVIG